MREASAVGNKVYSGRNRFCAFGDLVSAHGSRTDEEEERGNEDLAFCERAMGLAMDGWSGLFWIAGRDGMRRAEMWDK